MQTRLASDTIEMICRISPLITIPTVNDIALAAPLAHALTRGRLPVIEISIRDPNAGALIREMSHVPDALVGAGMILTPDDVRAARAAGAKFCSSPGITDPLLRFLDGIEMPFLPGAATPTEAMHLLSRGYSVLNYFPGGSASALQTLSALRLAIPHMTFSVSGGINENNYLDYMDLDNILNVKSDIAAPADLIAKRDWVTITRFARNFAHLKSGQRRIEPELAYNQA